jgi:hypothetical protein|tara:strand:+ start:56636 stop:57334 length:699 start_codon:yes stop_codon:yes gene_type:complete
MKIEFKGNTISNLADWKKFVFIGKKAKDWKEDRSAASLAEFIIKKNGEEKIIELVSAQIEEPFTLEVAYPEFQARFDAHGQGREHDLAIFGKTESGKKIFIGVEAKVDESFGGTVASKYHKGKAKELNGENTNLPIRIEELLKFNFKVITASDFNLRYQLLFSTAGTLSIDADIHILLFLVFKTEGYNPKVAAKNYKDLQAFLKKAEAINVDGNIYELNMNNKALSVVYKEI